jgi:hypothetical protein
MIMEINAIFVRIVTVGGLKIVRFYQQTKGSQSETLTQAFNEEREG